MLKKAAKHSPKTDPITGDRILFHGLPIGVLGIISVGTAVMIFWISLFESPPKDNTEVFILGILLAFFTIAGIALILEWLTARVVISSAGIIAKAPWPWYPKKLLWEEIDQIGFSYIFDSFTVKDGKHVTIRIAYFMYGIEYLSECFKQNLKPTTYHQVGGLMETIKRYAS